jgi:hypothetical protein
MSCLLLEHCHKKEQAIEIQGEIVCNMPLAWPMVA